MDSEAEHGGISAQDGREADTYVPDWRSLYHLSTALFGFVRDMRSGLLEYNEVKWEALTQRPHHGRLVDQGALIVMELRSKRMRSSQDWPSGVPTAGHLRSRRPGSSAHRVSLL